MSNDKNVFNEAEQVTANREQYDWAVYLYYSDKNEDKSKQLVLNSLFKFKSLINGHPILFTGLSEYDRVENVGKYVDDVMDHLKSNDDEDINNYKRIVLMKKLSLLSFTLQGVELSATPANLDVWDDIFMNTNPHDLYMVFYSYPKAPNYHAVLYPEYENAEKLFNSLVRRFGDEKYVKVKYGKAYYQKNEETKNSDFMAVFSYAQANPKKCNFKDLLKYTIGNTKLDG